MSRSLWASCTFVALAAAVAAPQQQSSQPAAQPEKVELYAKVITVAEKKKLESVKLDARTMLLYSRALDASRGYDDVGFRLVRDLNP